MIFSKERLLNNWHLMRIVKLAIGLYLFAGAFYMKEWMFGIMGIFFLYQAVSDTTCCGAAGCNTRSNSRRQRVYNKPPDDTDVDYEEIK